MQFQKIAIPPHIGHFALEPPPPGILVIFQLGLRPPENNSSVKIAVALYYFEKDNSFFDKERKILSLMSVLCLIVLIKVARLDFLGLITPSFEH